MKKIVLLTVICALAAACDVVSGPASQNLIVNSSIGSLDAGTKNLNAVPYGTTVAQLKAALTAHDGATFDILESSGGSAVSNQSSTYVEDQMVIGGHLSDGTAQEFAIGMETLVNTMVLSVDGRILRFDTDYFVNSPTELIIVDHDSGTHLYMVSTIASGEHESLDPANHVIDMELMDPDNNNTYLGGTSGTDAVFTVIVTDNEISGRVVGHVETNGNSLELTGWFHSDKNPDGGWI